MDKMKAAVFEDFGRFAVRDVPMPEITRPDEVIIRVLVCSICGTDVNLSSRPSGYGDMRGRIMGHELVGEVHSVGAAVTTLKPGDRVVVNPNSFCGVCAACRAGYHNHCERMELMGITHPGGFAQYAKSYEKLVFKISKNIPIGHAAFAEPLSCAMNGFSRLDITPGDTCLQIGCGPIGLLFAQLARLSGARVVCVEPKATRRAIAEGLGFIVFAPDTPDLKEKLIGMWGRRANFCIDAAGGQLPVAVDMAEFCGSILCFASSRVEGEVNLAPIQSKELRVMGSFIIHDSMPRAITMLESGAFTLDPIITHELPLERVQDGIELMKSGEGMEIIVNIG